jgi:hypothetical protein
MHNAARLWLPTFRRCLLPLKSSTRCQYSEAHDFNVPVLYMYAFTRHYKSTCIYGFILCCWVPHCSCLMGTQSCSDLQSACRCCATQPWILPQIRSPTGTFHVFYSLLKASEYTVGVCFDTLQHRGWVVDTPEYSYTGCMYRPRERLSRPRLLQRKSRTFGRSYRHVQKPRESCRRTSKLCTVAPNIYGSLMWNLPHFTLQAPRILRWLLGL